MTQRALPLSTAYRPLDHKPHAIVADYPAGFSEAKHAFLDWHRNGKPVHERGRCEHCNRTESEVRAAGEGETNCSHIDHNPDDLTAFQALCPRCHRANDKVQQSCAAAITLICEGRLVGERFRVRWLDLLSAVERLRLPGVTPGGADLVVVVALHDAPAGSSESELIAAFRGLLGGLRGETDEDVQAVVRAALKRLKLRRVPVFTTDGVTVGGSLVWYGSGRYYLRLTAPLTLPPEVTEPPPSLWEAADREIKLARNSRYARR